MTDRNNKDIDDVYEERNLLACALAQATNSPSGWKPDPESPEEWAIVWIETPAGQVSWHVPKLGAVESCLMHQQSEYDGYDRREKNRRLIEWMQRGCPPTRIEHDGREPDDTGDAEDVLRDALGDDVMDQPDKSE